jgi:hypothetical protein
MGVLCLQCERERELVPVVPAHASKLGNPGVRSERPSARIVIAS